MNCFEKAKDDFSRRLPFIRPIYIALSVMILPIVQCGEPANSVSQAGNSALVFEIPSDPGFPVFRDDFDGGYIDPAWTWQNREASTYQIKDGWLEITGGSESFLTGGEQTNLLWQTLPQGDFVLTIRLKAQPLFDFQRSGIILFTDADNYVFLSRGYCMQCVLGGSGIFLEYNLDNDKARAAVSTDSTEMFLMLIRTGNGIGAFYSVENGLWKNLANIETRFPFAYVGLSVTNDSQWEQGYDVVGGFDFFDLRPFFHPENRPESRSAPWVIY